ncbi:hypothetical protein ABZ479_16655 [Streptomyces sp. NPDC005722]
MAPRFDTARFHVATGPAALFARVRHVLREPARLTARGPHVTERLERRGAPVEALLAFDPASWEPVSAEVRTDTGKWVKATWRVRVAGQDWWAVIGFGDTLVTVVDVAPHRQGLGDDIVREGPLYERVAAVNEALMARG